MRIHVLWLGAALLAGLVLGAWGPRMDLKQAREELRALRERQSAQSGKSVEISGLRNMLRLPEGEQRAQSRPRQRPRTPPEPAPTNAPAASDGPAAAGVTNRAPDRAVAHERLREASELWRTRVGLARQGFVSNVELDPEQEKAFDVLVESMNLRLGERIDAWAGALRGKGAVKPEDGVRMLNDLSGVLVLTYDEMDRAMPQGWRDKAGEHFELVNFIDPDVVTPLIEVEGLGAGEAGPFNHHRRRGRAPRGGGGGEDAARQESLEP